MAAGELMTLQLLRHSNVLAVKSCNHAVRCCYLYYKAAHSKWQRNTKSYAMTVSCMAGRSRRHVAATA
jgi:hypothetical protein